MKKQDIMLLLTRGRYEQIFEFIDELQSENEALKVKSRLFEEFMVSIDEEYGCDSDLQETELEDRCRIKLIDLYNAWEPDIKKYTCASECGLKARYPLSCYDHLCVYVTEVE